MSVFQSIKRVLRKRGETCAAILVAAGSSSRMDGQDKLLAELGGMTVLERSALAFEQNDRISELVVVTRADRLDEISKLLDARGLSKLTMVAAGGETRADSVRAGLEHVLRCSDNLTIMTNDVFSGGADYGEETRNYMRALAAFNRNLAARADLAVEVVCGLPNVLKGELP